MRKKAATSIFNPKKRLLKRPAPAQMHTAAGQVPMSGIQAIAPTPSARSAPNGHGAAPPPQDDPSQYMEYPIYISKDSLMQGLHYHAFKLQTDDRNALGQPMEVNPYKEQQFTRPVRLHRRLARDKMLEEQSAAASDADDKDREQREVKKAERQAEREANQAQIAPTGETAAAGKKPIKKKPQKKVEDVYWDESNPKHQQRSRLRYEEARPWHLEDFEGKNKWIGSYEEPLSKTNSMLEVTPDGFKLVPVEKWYKMVRSDRVAAMSGDQVEKMMTAKHTVPRWFMNSHEAAEAARKEAHDLKREQLANARRQPKREMDEDDGPAFVKNEEYRADVDEIDFEFNDEFQDDDEGFVFGDQGDDEVKDIERKLREEMRGANLAGTGVKDEDKDYDEEEQAEKRAQDDEKKKQKKLRRKLKKKELRHEYESDTDDENKYEESSESEDSEEEREREEEERKKEEARKAAQPNSDRSGASSKGTNTPTGRSEKKAASGISLKRDADLSELSGNESSRKKVKMNGTAVPNRAHSLSRKFSSGFHPRPHADNEGTADAAKRIPSGYGSGSETDTSRAGRPGPKIMIKNSPPGTRPGSSQNGTPAGSRAQSPARAPQPFPTLDEIRAAIPAGGIVIGELVRRFKPRIGEKGGDFITMVKQVGRQDAASKRIVLKD